MTIAKTHFNWFDILVMGLVAFGIWRGRKRGMSEELLDVFQWLTIVVAGALLYAPIGHLIASFTRFPPFWANIIAYTLLALVIRLMFGIVKQAAGEKLVQSDAFGRMEYYFGMVAGTVRFSCILIFALSFLHARHISESERLANAKMQADNFGAISFPTFGSLQQSIFYESVSGTFIRKNLRAQLVQPAGGKLTLGGSDTMGRRRERAVEEVYK
jgi:uncharacterized membrane protein required for colicin V production